MKTFLAYIGGAVSVVAVTGFAAVLNGYALAKLWRWFIAPQFGLPTLSIPMAIGLALTIGFLTKEVDNCQKEKKDAKTATIEAFAVMLGKPIFALFTGWIVTLFL